MWLGIDVGTGGSRALLVDERGGVRAGYTALHEDMQMAHPQWAEQRPENWWDRVVEAIRGVLAQAAVSGADVKGTCVKCGQPAAGEAWFAKAY